MELAGMHKLAQLQNWMELQNSTFNAPIPFHALVIDTGANHFPFTPLAKQNISESFQTRKSIPTTWSQYAIHLHVAPQSRNTVFTGGTDTTVILQLFGMDCNV